MSQIRDSGASTWRPSVGLRVSWLLLAVAFLAGTSWLAFSGAELSLKDKATYVVVDAASIVLLPVVLCRWRMVLRGDVLSLVFIRVRRVAVREIVDAKSVPGSGLTFVLRDGRTASFGALGNSAWGHRRPDPTRADLAARAVLSAAAIARGEPPVTEFRLPAMKGVGKAAVKGGLLAALVGLFLGN